jgi:hypothetical protein
MHTIDTNDALAVLLPGSDEPWIALFHRGSRAGGAAARRAFEGMSWSSRCNVAIVDTESAPFAEQWFGLGAEPAMAAVLGGALIVVETEITAAAARRILEQGCPQLERLRSDDRALTVAPSALDSFESALHGD